MNFSQDDQLKNLLVLRVNHSHKDESLAFLKANQREIKETIEIGKGIFFSGFCINNADDFYEVLQTLGFNVIPYSGAKVRSSGTRDFKKFVYSPTSTPNFLKNYLHNEMAYTPNVPSKIGLFCDIPATVGGETLLGDQQDLYEMLPVEITKEFERRKLRFTRHLMGRTWWQEYLSKRFSFFALLTSWQNNFQTDCREVVDEKARTQGLETQWHDNGDLSLHCVIDPIKYHPKTGKKMWVNNGHLFQLKKEVYGFWLYYFFKLSMKLFNLPHSVCHFGDGAPISKDKIKTLLNVMNAHEKTYPLKHGEFVLMHNHCLSHGRKTFKGKRRLFFAVMD